MSLEKLYSILKDIDAKVDEVYKLKDSEDAQINKLIGELKVKVQEEVERFIKSTVDEYKNNKYKELEDEVKKYSENINKELDEFRKKVNNSLDKAVEEVIRLLLSG